MSETNEIEQNRNGTSDATTTTSDRLPLTEWVRHPTPRDELNPVRVEFDGIAPGMQAFKWTPWKLTGGADENGKKPMDARNPSRPGSHADPEKWGSFETVRDVVEQNDALGVGFPFAQEGHDYVGVDVDFAASESPAWLPDPRDYLGDATVEWSPSGNLRLLLRGVTVPEWWTDQSLYVTAERDNDEKREVATYTESKYVTVTGDLLPGQTPVIGTTTDLAFEKWLKLAWWALNPDADLAPWEDAPGDSDDESAASRTYTYTDGEYPDAADVVSGYDLGKRGEHPYHGSTTGKNFSLDADNGGETFRCWSSAHDCTGNGMHLLGIEAGIIECGEWTHGGLDAETWREICDYARSEGYDLPERAEANPEVAAGRSTDADAEGEPPAEPDASDPWHVRYDSWLARREWEAANEDGDRPRIDEKVDTLADLLLADYRFMTPIPTEGGTAQKELLYVYRPSEGRFVPGGVGVVEKMVSTRTDLLPTNVAHVTKTIRMRTQVDRETFDAGDDERDLVNVSNGVLDLATGDLHPHEPGYRFRKLIPHAWDPNAECPEVDAFIRDITADDDDAEMIYEWMGYCLLQDKYPIHAFLLLTGSGGNGKGACLRVFEEFIGTDEVSNVTFESLTTDSSFDLPELDEAMVNIDGDMPASTVTHEDLAHIKRLTGGSGVTVSRKNQQPFHMKNAAKMVFAANSPPRFWTNDNSVARRLLTVEFPYSFKQNPDGDDPTEKQKEPEERLFNRLLTDAEMSGLLTRAVDALQNVRARDDTFILQAKMSDAERFAAYDVASDPVKATARLCLKNEGGYCLPKDVVHNIHVNYCHANGVEPLGKTAFWKAMRRIDGIDVNGSQPRVGDSGKVRIMKRMWVTEEGLKYLNRGQRDLAVSAMKAIHPGNADYAEDLLDRTAAPDESEGVEHDDTVMDAVAATDGGAGDGDASPGTLADDPVPDDAEGIGADTKRLAHVLRETYRGEPVSKGQLVAAFEKHYPRTDPRHVPWGDRFEDMIDRMVTNGDAVDDSNGKYQLRPT